MLAYALVVLGLGQDFVVPSVGDGEDGALDAVEVFLYDHACGCVAEHPSEHLTKLMFRLVECGQDEHALAGTQAVGLEHVGWLQRLKESEAFFERRAVESLVAGGGDAVPLHECLGEVLAAL